MRSKNGAASRASATSPDPDEDLLQAPEIVEPCETSRDSWRGVATDESFEVCDFDQASWLVTAARVWGSEDEDGYLVAARVSVGSGSVTVVNGVPFVYRELFEGDHGELLAAATNFAPAITSCSCRKPT